LGSFDAKQETALQAANSKANEVAAVAGQLERALAATSADHEALRKQLDAQHAAHNAALAQLESRAESEAQLRAEVTASRAAVDVERAEKEEAARKLLHLEASAVEASTAMLGLRQQLEQLEGEKAAAEASTADELARLRSEVLDKEGQLALAWQQQRQAEAKPAEAAALPTEHLEVIDGLHRELDQVPCRAWVNAMLAIHPKSHKGSVQRCSQSDRCIELHPPSR
jgi:chromosome segregation ATPase